MNIVMHIKQTLTILAAVIGIATIANIVGSPQVHAAVTKEQFLDRVCPYVIKAGAGSAAQSGQVVNTDKLIKKCKQDKSQKKVGDFKYADWKDSKPARLSAAIAAGVTTPAALKDKEKEKEKEKEAKEDTSNEPDTANACKDAAIIKIKNCDDGESAIWGLLLIVINVLSAGVVMVAIGGFVYASILYSSAENNPGQISKAKEMIMNVVIGLVCYALMYAFLQFLIPGGVFQ